MTKLDDYKTELEDKIKSLAKKRDTLVLEIQKIQTEIETLVEQSYALDSTKVRITCFPKSAGGCAGTGYVTLEDGKKHICPVCNGKYFLWAEKYTEGKVTKDEDSG